MINFDNLYVSAPLSSIMSDDGVNMSLAVDSSTEVDIHNVVLNKIMTRLVNPNLNGLPVDETVDVSNACFSHLSGAFGRSVFDSRDIFASSDNEDGLNVFSHRTRARISKVHVFKSHKFDIESVRDYDIDHPVVTRTLSDDSKRKVILDFLALESTVTGLSKMLIGGTNQAETGTKRYTFTRLLSWVRNRGLKDSSNEVAIVATIILTSILDQFDWEFENLAPATVREVTSHVAELDDLHKLYVEGWLSKVVPNVSWVVKYAGSSKVTVAALEECISSSVLRLKRVLMPITLLKDRGSDVINAAKIACAINLGLVESIPNETLLAFIQSSPVISEMAEWAAIVTEVFNNKFQIDLDLATHVGDLGLLNTFANEFADAINGNSLITVTDVGSFLKHITVKHYDVSGISAKGRYHTGIFGNLDANVAPRHYIESQLSNNIYGVDIIKENNAFNDDMRKSILSSYGHAVEYLCERDAVVTYGALSEFVDPEDLITRGKHGFTIAGLCAKDIRLLALVSSELLIRYSRNVSSVEGVNRFDVLDVAYVISNAHESLANPLPTFEGDAYTASAIVACCFNVAARNGTGQSPLLEVIVGIDKVDYLFNPLSSSLGMLHSRKLPRSVLVELAIPDAGGNVINVNSGIDLCKYITLSTVDATFALVPHSTLAQLSIVDYALALASPEVSFRGLNSQYSYDLERTSANYLINIYNLFISNVLLRNMAANIRHDIARQMSGAVGSFTTAYNNLELRVQSHLLGASIPLMLYLGDLDNQFDLKLVGNADLFLNAFSNNRLFRDAILAKVAK